jgi:hypothetical protein
MSQTTLGRYASVNLAQASTVIPWVIPESIGRYLSAVSRTTLGIDRRHAQA